MGRELETIFYLEIESFEKKVKYVFDYFLRIFLFLIFRGNFESGKFKKLNAMKF